MKETSRSKKYKLKKKHGRVKIQARRRYSLASNSLRKIRMLLRSKTRRVRKVTI